MSRIAVVTSSPPFAEGGHLVHARALVATLAECGHAADLVITPQNRFGRQAAAYTATWLTDVGRTAEGEVVDQVISMRFPSYAIRHERHACWLLHTMREYYDQWDTFSGSLSWPARVKERARRRAIHAADRYLLTRNVSKLFVNSRTVQRRLEVLGDIRSEVLYPPPPPRAYRTDDYEPYLFAVSRFTTLKRMSLIVEALAEREADGIRAVLAGEGELLEDARRLVRERGLSDRVTLPGRLDETALTDHLARCRAVVFPPKAEDFGFVTVEGFASAKPVITCTDSGGPTELVEDDVNGLVCEPTPAALARAFRRVIASRDVAERLGTAGAAVAAQMTWQAAVRRLLLV